MFKVISDFRDAKDNNRLYRIGDQYPAEDALKPTKARILELSTGKNALGKAFIEEIHQIQAKTK